MLPKGPQPTLTAAEGTPTSVTPLSFSREGPGYVLCLGAHCDDLEIGCGGTLAELGKALSRRALPLVGALGR